MKKLLVLFSLLGLLSMVRAEDGIQFEHGTWAQTLSKAATENKLVFLDAYTSWCGPCKWMARTAFVDPAVAEYFNSHFVNAKIDMEQGEGPDLAKKYYVTAYPTLLFVSSTGELVHTAIGARSAEELLSLAKDVLEGNFTSLPAMKARFEKGERDRKFLHDYILATYEVAGSFQAPLDVYKEGMKGDALLEKDNWEVFQAIYGRYDSEFAQYFRAHLPEFQARYGMEAVRQKVMILYLNGVSAAGRNGDKAAFAAIVKDFEDAHLERADSMRPLLDMIWTAEREDWKGYATATKLYVTKLAPTETIALNDFAWTFYEKMKSKSDLRLALEWVNRSIEGEKSYPNLDTKAMLLKKLGRTSEAIAVAKEAIEMGKAAGEDVTETEKALAEMEGR